MFCSTDACRIAAWLSRAGQACHQGMGGRFPVPVNSELLDVAPFLGPSRIQAPGGTFRMKEKRGGLLLLTLEVTFTNDSNVT